MYWNRFDIVEAYYLFFSEYYRGQGSNMYKRMCKIRSYFKPGASFSYDSMSDNAKAIYDELVTVYEDAMERLK